MTTTNIATHYAGELAYLDSFAGLVPVRVTSVKQLPLRSFPIVEYYVTAARPGYRTGFISETGPAHIIPRKSVRTRNGQYKIVGSWVWAPAPETEESAS